MNQDQFRQLSVSLKDLSDLEFQRHAWFASGGKYVSSFDEQVCQTFDDTGLSDYLERNQRPKGVSADAFEALRNLEQAISSVNGRLPREELIHDSRVERVRKLAAEARELLVSQSTKSDPT